MAELWQMTREQFFNDPDLVRSHIPEANKGFKVSYKYIDPPPGGPFVGDMVVNTKPAKGSEIPAMFGRAKVTAVSPAKPQKLDNMQLFTAGKKIHRDAVERAMREGKQVPPNVLRDYPDLSVKGASMSTVAMSRKERYMASLAASKGAAAAPPPAKPAAPPVAAPSADAPPPASPPNSRRANYVRAKLAGTLGQPAAAQASSVAAGSTPENGSTVVHPKYGKAVVQFVDKRGPMQQWMLVARLADGTQITRPASEFKPSASAGHVPDDGSGSVPAKNWFGKPKPGQAPVPPKKPDAAAAIAPTGQRVSIQFPDQNAANAFTRVADQHQSVTVAEAKNGRVLLLVDPGDTAAIAALKQAAMAGGAKSVPLAQGAVSAADAPYTRKLPFTNSTMAAKLIQNAKAAGVKVEWSNGPAADGKGKVFYVTLTGDRAKVQSLLYSPAGASTVSAAGTCPHCGK